MLITLSTILTLDLTSLDVLLSSFFVILSYSKCRAPQVKRGQEVNPHTNPLMCLYAHELLGFVLTRVDSANPDTVIQISMCKRGLSYDGKTWYIANRGPSDHEAIGNVAGAGRRGTSEPTPAANGKVI